MGEGQPTLLLPGGLGRLEAERPGGGGSLQGVSSQFREGGGLVSWEIPGKASLALCGPAT